MKATKTMVEPQKRRESSYSRETLYHKYESYCCPNCPRLPEILYYNKANNTLKLNCQEHKEIIIDITEYMEKMATFERKSDLRNENKCSIHKQKYSYFCQNCNKNLCKECFLDKMHEKHIKYNINALNPDNTELLFVKNDIEMLFQKKNELLRQIKIIDDNITFLDTLIIAYERYKPNVFLNLNLKHLVYGEELNMDEIKNTEFVETQSKKDNFDEFIKNNFIKATEGLNKLNIVEQKVGDYVLEELFKGIETNSFYKMLLLAGQIKGPKDMITFKTLKYLNLRGNNLTSINFLSKKDFPALEMLSLNDNEITDIEPLRNVSFPSLRELYLSNNKIDNIDALENMKTPKLRMLWLSENNITSIDVLAKVKFPELLKLNLGKNKISDIKVFAKNKAKFPQLYELYLNDNQFELKDFNKIIELLFLKVKQLYY